MKKSILLFLSISGLLLAGKERFAKDDVELCLKQQGFDFLLERTSFIKNLTEQEHNAETLIQAVDAAYIEYGNYIKEESRIRALAQNKPKLLKLILEKRPEFLKEVEALLFPEKKP